ncbi:MAG: molybdopterin oxidoreductase family protein, partial [Candidatus Thorarchaeota archaeon]
NKLIDPPGEAKPDWWVVVQVAERMGHKDKFDFSAPAEILEEIRRVVPPYKGITYDRLEKNIGGIQWPCPTEEHPGTATFFIEKFNTPDGMGHLQVIESQQSAELPDKEYPYILSSGRSIFHYHTGSMTRRTPKLEAEIDEAFCQVNPEDATREQIQKGDKIILTTRRGSIETEVRVTNQVPKGMLFVPFHFSEASVNRLTNPVLDPTCAMPEYKVCAVKMEVVK